MVKEKRIVVSLADIAKIRFCCEECGTEVTQDTDQDQLPQACPSCYHAWVAPIGRSVYTAFINALQVARNNGGQGVRIQLVLETAD